MTTTFIVNAKEVHGDKYNYSLVEYIIQQKYRYLKTHK